MTTKTIYLLSESVNGISFGNDYLWEMISEKTKLELLLSNASNFIARNDIASDSFANFARILLAMNDYKKLN